MASPKIIAEPGKEPGGTVLKDLRKAPRGQPDEPIVEAGSEEEALVLANKRNRAVFTPQGYVCPSILRERR